jgi:hypothetical protein
MNSFVPNTPEVVLRRESWRRLFADMIEAARRGTGRKIGQAARLAGMEISEWLVIETGYKRPDEVEVDQMAPVLHMSHDQMARLVHLCHEAWPE